MTEITADFDLDCPRLATFLDDNAKEYPEYHVPLFGVKNPKFLIVRLAPGIHGANATGRPFTADIDGLLTKPLKIK